MGVSIQMEEQILEQLNYCKKQVDICQETRNMSESYSTGRYWEGARDVYEHIYENLLALCQKHDIPVL